MSEAMHLITGRMPRRAVLGGLAATGLAGLLPGATPQGAAARAGFPRVAALIASYVDSGRLPGLIAALGLGEGPLVDLARGTISRNSDVPVDADSLFRIYSMTKPITGLAVTILIDERRLALDQPLADLLPRFAAMQVQDVPDGPIDRVHPARTPITIRHLLTHTAGLGYTIIQKGPIKAAYEAAGLVPARVSRIPVPDMDTLHPAPDLATFADRLAAMPLVFEPGTRWSYSVAFDLLGRVIEVASGQRFDRFLSERVLGPLGMDSTGFAVAPRDAGRLVTNYGVVGGRPVPLDAGRTSIYLRTPVFPFGGSGLVSSARDYDRFLQALLGEGRIGSRQAISAPAARLAVQNLLPEAVDTTGIMGPRFGFGAGGRVGLGADAGTFGWSGAAGTIGFVSFRASLRAALFAQYMPFETFPVQKEFPEAVRADIEAALTAHGA